MIKIAVKILNELSSPVNKPEKMLKEGVDTSSDDIMVYMNTWKNYNEYGADLEMYGIIKFFQYKEDVDLNLSNEEMRAFIRFLIKEEIGEISNNAYLEFKKQEDK